MLGPVTHGALVKKDALATRESGAELFSRAADSFIVRTGFLHSTHVTVSGPGIWDSMD